jgi:hypothetical protein
MIMNSRVTKTRSKTSERCTPKSPYDATPNLIATNSIRKRRYIKLLKLEDERLRSNWGYAIRRALSSPPRRGLHAMDTALSIGLNELRKEVPQPTLISVPLHMRGGIELSTGLSVKRGLYLPLRGIDLVGVVLGVSDDDRPSPWVRARRRGGEAAERADRQATAALSDAELAQLLALLGKVLKRQHLLAGGSRGHL